MQVVTGILLALVYSPSANEAWSSLQFLNHNVALGWYLRALHGWGSDFMVAIVLIHMVQVFLFGAYKFPRELTWIIGVLLLLLTLGMAFTGQVLRFDQDAYWGLGIGASILSRVPFIGAPLVHLMLGGPIIGGATLSRFFTLHVFVIPGSTARRSRCPHLDDALARRQRLAYARPHRQQIHLRARVPRTHNKTGIPFVPDAAWKDAVFAAAIMFSVMACAFFFGPFGPERPTRSRPSSRPYPSPTSLSFGSMRCSPFFRPRIETPVMLTVPILVIAGMLLLPALRRRGRAPLGATSRSPF